MYKIANPNPQDNLDASVYMMNQIYEYKKNGWAIGQLYPSGGPDQFTYFFAMRNMTVYTYLRGTISMGEPTAYDKNINVLKDYMNSMLCEEFALVDAEIDRILYYKSKNWAIGESYPDGGPDEFVVFFGVRNLQVQPYMAGSVVIGTPQAYDENIRILTEYKRMLQQYYQ